MATRQDISVNCCFETRKRFFEKVSGQSLTEYALIAGLVSIVSIAALSNLGTLLSGQIATISNAMGSPGSSSGTLALTGGGGTVTGGGAAGSPPQGSGGGSSGSGTTALSGATQRVCLNNSTCIDIPKIPQGGGNVSDVAGNLGGDLIENYAKSLDALVAQLKNEPGVTDVDLQPLVDLAQKGHTLGDNVSTLDKICKIAGGPGGCTTGTVSEAPQDQLLAAGVKQEQLNKFYELDDAANLRGDATAFENQFQLVQSLFSSSLQGKISPASQKLVSTMANEIIKVNNGAVLTEPTTGSLAMAAFSVNPTNSAQLIHIDANTICGTSGSDQCKVTTP